MSAHEAIADFMLRERLSIRARNFALANEGSPVVYGSVDEGRVTYRLANGKLFRLNSEEARQVPNPRWEFAA